MEGTIPLRDNVPSRHAPFMTYLLLAVNTAVFIHEQSLAPAALERFIRRYALIPADFTTFDPNALFMMAGGYADFLTAIFLHGSWFHLISNMWVLWLFADNVEDRLGPLRFLLFYLAAGVSANVLHYYTNIGSAAPTLGASGAIAGVMGAYFLLYPRARIVTLIPILFYPLIIQVPAALYLLIWFATQVWSGLAGPQGAGGVAWWAHVGGFLSGMLLLILLRNDDRRSRSGPVW